MKNRKTAKLTTDGKNVEVAESPTLLDQLVVKMSFKPGPEALERRLEVWE